MNRIAAPVLVTGAGGFVGRRLIARLLEEGVDTVGLMLPGEAVPPEWGARVRVVRGDVCDARAMREAIRGMGTVFHLAALVAEATGDYEAHWRVTAEGSRNVYAAASEAGARVVVTTSICAYGDAVQRGVCREDTPRGQHQGPYGRAKQAQEDLAHEAARERGLAVTIARPSNVYGVGSRPWVELLGAMIRSGSMAVIGDGSGNAGLVHVDNLADALVAVASAPRAVGRTYNVCDGLDVSWRRYIDDLARILDAPAPPSVPRETVYAAARSNEDLEARVGPKNEAIPALEVLNLIGSDNRFDTTRIREECGWSPRVGYAEALEQIRAHLRGG